MAKQSNGKKKARVFFEVLVQSSPPIHVKVQRTTTKHKRRGVVYTVL